MVLSILTAPVLFAGEAVPMLLGKGQWGVSPKHEVVRMALRVEVCFQLQIPKDVGFGAGFCALCVCVCRRHLRRLSW